MRSLLKTMPRSPLLGLIVLSIIVRGTVAALRQTPEMFPDEYIYSAIARGFATSGLPLIRGHAAHFPAILYPLLSAPAWLFHNVSTSYRVAQAEGVVCMSLVAIPTNLLARHLGCSRKGALAAAAVALACPDMIYSGWMLSETIAYPLAILTFYLIVRALDKPTWRLQAAALSAAILLVLARIQFVSLIAAYLLAMLIVGIRTRDKSYLKAHRALLGSAVLLGVSVIFVGISKVVGFYAAALRSYPLGRTIVWFGKDMLAFMYASGWGLVPAAIVGIVMMIWNPQNRADLSMGALLIPFAAASFTEAAAYSVTGRVQERYIFYLVPLVAVAAIRYYERQMPFRIVHACLALTLLAPAAMTRLASTLFSQENDGSPMLLGGSWAESSLGLAVPDLLFLISCVVALLLALMPMIRLRATWIVSTGSAVLLMIALSASVACFDIGNTTLAGPHQDWVDHLHPGKPVHLVTTSYDSRLNESNLLFWNRSIKDVIVLPGGASPDVFGGVQGRITETGLLVADGKFVRDPVVIDDQTVTAELADASIARDPEFTFWKPEGPVRFFTLTHGLSKIGELATQGDFNVWNKTPFRGYIQIRLGAFRAATQPARLWFGTGAHRRLVVVPVGGRQQIRFRVCSGTHFKMVFKAAQSPKDPLHGATVFIGNHLWATGSSAPRYIPDPSACLARASRN